jgi:hypothetical protein
MGTAGRMLTRGWLARGLIPNHLRRLTAAETETRFRVLAATETETRFRVLAETDMETRVRKVSVV